MEKTKKKKEVEIKVGDQFFEYKTTNDLRPFSRLNLCITEAKTKTPQINLSQVSAFQSRYYSAK